jgi:hypothetical protein
MYIQPAGFILRLEKNPLNGTKRKVKASLIHTTLEGF